MHLSSNNCGSRGYKQELGHDSVTPMLVEMSNTLKTLNFRLSALAKHVLQFDGQLCELSAEEFTNAWFAEELNFYELPATVREHLYSTTVLFKKSASHHCRPHAGIHYAVQLFLVRKPPPWLQLAHDRADPALQRR